MTLSVLALTRYDRRGASSRVRFYAYADALEQAGIAVTAAPFLDQDYLDARYAGGSRWRLALQAYRRRLRVMSEARRYDLLWIEKELFPWLPRLCEALTIRRLPYAMDIDDAWYLRYRQRRLSPIRTLCGDKLEGLARGAAVVLAGNDNLADWARTSGARNVLVLPSVVDLAHYKATPTPGGPFTIGWIGTPQTAEYLTLIAKPLHDFCREHGARLLVIGAPSFSLEGVPIVHEAWSEAREAALLARCHVGVMPLPDDEWSRGKCGYKLIQYMAGGRAVVASPVGANNTIVRPNENGFLAATAEDWRSAFAWLRYNPALGARLGQSGRRMVERDYSVAATARLLAEALYRAAGRTAPAL
jgi:glycosyltransferase involved in cell wall biosynthesis